MAGTSRLVKSNRVVVSQRYMGSDESLPATTHLRAQLVQHGWFACEPDNLEYCKGTLRASMETTSLPLGEWEIFLVLRGDP